MSKYQELQYKLTAIITNTTPPKAHCPNWALIAFWVIGVTTTHWGLFVTTSWVPLCDVDCVCVIFNYNCFYLREEILFESKQYSSSILLTTYKSYLKSNLQLTYQI